MQVACDETTTQENLRHVVAALVGASMVGSGLWMMVHGITSLLIAKPDFPWPDREQLIEHVLQTYGAGLRAGGPAGPAGRDV